MSPVRANRSTVEKLLWIKGPNVTRMADKNHPKTVFKKQMAGMGDN